MITSKKKDASKLSKRKVATIATVLLLIASLAILPAHQAFIFLAKVCQVTFGAVLAYWIDKVLQPQVDMGQLSKIIEEGDNADKDRAVQLAQAAMIRRALITIAVILGISLGL